MIKKILHFLVRLLLILLLMALVLGSILLYNLQMNKSFITTFYTVTVDKPVEDLRIVLLSDLHLSEYGTDNADLVQKVRNLAPDLIAVADALNDETNALDDVCTILICHCPEVLDTSLADEKFDLVLSGHAHGGQVRIGGHGLWSTSQGFLPKYTSGVNQMGESQVVISRGLGDSEPYPRIFNQPELVVVDVN